MFCVVNAMDRCRASPEQARLNHPMTTLGSDSLISVAILSPTPFSVRVHKLHSTKLECLFCISCRELGSRYLGSQRVTNIDLGLSRILAYSRMTIN